MRVAILGVGGLGRTLASELRTDPKVTALLLADRKGERARILTAIQGRVAIEARQLNVEDATLLTRAIRGYDVVVNTALPKYNFAIMEAALQAGTDYLDVSATGPRTPGGKPGIVEQFEFDERFKAAGRTALLSMGLDPGMSNVMAKDAAGHLDSVDAIRIRTGGVSNQASIQPFPLYSREAFISDILVPPTVWEDGSLREREPLSEEETYTFPDPIGSQRAYLTSHEETKTLPRFLGKPVRRIDYKVALEANLVRALISLQRLGLLEDDRVVRVGEQMVPFRRALLAAFPEPSALMLPLQGYEAVSVEVAGTRGGQGVVRRGDILFGHQEANRRRSTTAVYYLTAVGASIGITALAEKKAGGPGVVAPECLDPAMVWKEWTARKLPITWSERAAA